MMRSSRANRRMRRCPWGLKATVNRKTCTSAAAPALGFIPRRKSSAGRWSRSIARRPAVGSGFGRWKRATAGCLLRRSERDADDETLARVIDRPVEAWIGSNVERVKRHESQVVLEPGEEVVVLGERASEGDEPWLKIAPPRGEFRWVHSKHLSNKSAKQLPMMTPARK